METKGEKFVRLANARTNRAVDAIRSIGKLSNTNHYSYTETQADQIIRELKAEVEDLKSRFKQNNKKKTFSL